MLGDLLPIFFTLAGGLGFFAAVAGGVVLVVASRLGVLRRLLSRADSVSCEQFAGLPEGARWHGKLIGHAEPLHDHHLAPGSQLRTAWYRIIIEDTRDPAEVVTLLDEMAAPGFRIHDETGVVEVDCAGAQLNETQWRVWSCAHDPRTNPDTVLTEITDRQRGTGEYIVREWALETKRDCLVLGHHLTTVHSTDVFGPRVLGYREEDAPLLLSAAGETETRQSLHSAEGGLRGLGQALTISGVTAFAGALAYAFWL